MTLTEKQQLKTLLDNFTAELETVYPGYKFVPTLDQIDKVTNEINDILQVEDELNAL